MKLPYQVNATSWFVFFLLFVAACASVGLPTAETFNEKLAVGYGTVTQIRQTALTLLQAKKIGPDDAQNAQNAADQGRQALDIARGISKNDMSAAQNKLQMATAILTATQAYLATRQKGD